LGWPIPEDTDFETVAGFILDIADGLPKPKESFDVAGYRFKVVAMRRKRVSKLRVTAPAPAPRPHALTDAPSPASSSASANMSSSVQ
jgi:putative hemolysin